MIFLDTCIWIELLSVKTPIEEYQKEQARAAARLLRDTSISEGGIVTCKEQLLELVNAITKVKKEEISKKRKKEGVAGIGNMKSFRNVPEFLETKELCRIVVEDVIHFAELHDVGDYNITSILDRLELADLNDCIYYDYCKKEKIDFYTFDVDLIQLGEHEHLHTYSIDKGMWT